MKVALEIDEFSYYRYSEILSFNHSQKIGKIIPGIRVPRNIYNYAIFIPTILCRCQLRSNLSLVRTFLLY